MTGFFILISNIAAGSVRAVTCLLLISRLLFMENVKKPGRKSIASALAGMAVISAILSVTGLSDFYRMVLETVLITVCASRFQKADTRMSLFVGIFYEIAISFWQFLFAAWLGVIFRCPAFLDYETGSGQIAIWCIHLLLIALAWYLWKHLNMAGKEAFRYAPVVPVSRHCSLSKHCSLGKHSSLSKHCSVGNVPSGCAGNQGSLSIPADATRVSSPAASCAASLMPRHAGVLVVAAGFLAVVSLSEQSVLAIADDTLDMWTILAVVLMMSVLMFNMNRQYEVEKELARLKSEQAKLLERDYTALNNAYAINAKLFHDFHNHIGVMRQLLSHHKTEEAMQYLDELQAPVRKMADTVWTGDETVDYLINSKAVTAEESGIAYQAQVEFPRHTNLQSADLCAILGNLLDNALEAAKQIPAPKQRFIKLTIRRINQMLIIKVENSFATQPVKQDGMLKTSKEGGGLHGWGLKSAQTAAGKYDGMVQTAYADNTFRAVVTLSYQSVSVE